MAVGSSGSLKVAGKDAQAPSVAVSDKTPQRVALETFDGFDGFDMV
jgi:hypothetical protein